MRNLLALATSIVGASATIYYAGVAESSGEFGVWSQDSIKGTGLPGKFGVDYSFINPDAVDIFIDEHKVNLFRVAFLLERMCPLATGLGSTFDETHFNHFKDAIDHITVKKGAYAILDPHNYMRYGDPSSQPMSGPIIGDSADPESASTAQFAEFWGELAGRFKDNEKVMFGIMNEPHDMATSLVLENNQAAVDAIRAAGADNLILVPGGQWSGGHSWMDSWNAQEGPNSDYMGKIEDPADNWVLDIHEYLDEDFSGTHTECTKPAPEALAGVTAWLKENGLKAMITEFGGSPTPACDEMLTDMLNYMADNDVYIGWTAWAAGPFWGPNSPCCTDQKQLGSLEPGISAAGGAASIYETIWKKIFVPQIPDTLQWDGPATSNGPPM